MAERPRVLVLLKTLAVGGAEMLVLQSARIWNRARFDYRVGCLGGSQELEQSFSGEGMTTVRLCNNANDPRAALALRRYLREQDIDLVHAHLAQPTLLTHLARRGLKTRLVASNHCDESAMRPITRQLARLAWPRADAAIAVGESVAVETANPRTRVLLNGVQRSRFESATPAELGVPGDAVVVLLLANLHERKRPIETLRVFERACAEVPAAHLIVAGTGPLHPQLEAAARASSLQGRIHLLGERRDVPALVRRADVSILLSRAEGLPMSLLESAAGGAALLATKVSSVESFVRHDDTGLLASNDEEAAAHLKALTTDAALRARLAENARALLAREFSLEANVRATEALYEEVLGEGR